MFLYVYVSSESVGICPRAFRHSRRHLWGSLSDSLIYVHVHIHVQPCLFFILVLDFEDVEVLVVIRPLRPFGSS